jgi:response regulator RpfG family c-di-GMP phosphodiesterase
MGQDMTEPTTAPVRCLIVDDEPSVRQALRKIVEKQGLAVTEAENGRTALAYLAEHGDVPVCIADIQMPEMDGVAFLRESQRRHPDMAVLMLTGMADVRTAVECLQIGALDYLSKPVMPGEVHARINKALEKRELILQNRFYQQHLEHRVRELDRLNRQSLLNGVQTLVHALEAKDAYTSGHSQRVSRYAHRTAMHLGVTGDELELIRLGGELHDIGKIGTREAVLNKPGALDDAEFAHIKLHTILGERILAPVFAEQVTVLRIVRSHHERMDGRGFPDGLPGDQIPLEARIAAVADAFDAMTTSRAYRASRTPELAYEELTRCRGTHFDPNVVDAFLRAFPDPSRLPLAI